MELEADILKCFRAGVLAIDLSGVILYRNEIAEKILNHCSIAVGGNLRPMAGDNSFFRVLLDSLELRYLPSRMEAILPGREGTRRMIGFTLAELKEGGRRTGICAFFKDLTHVEMAEENRDLDARLRLLGQMAAGLAHEIRNPITSIGVHCGLMRMRHQGDPKMVSSLSHMESEIGKVEAIIRECLNFVRPAELNRKVVDVRPILEHLASEADRPLDDIRVSFQTGEEGGIEAEVDEVMFEQAVRNILVNGVQACGPGGRVLVSARRSRGFWDLDPGAREPMLCDASGEKEDFLAVSVKDNGKGIPEDIREKIFVPFFTTKKGGTGIGLPMVQKIVYAHKGVLDVVSETGKGTEFIIKIPLRSADA